LERRYRRVLRLLPAGYRQQWEEDMVASFLAAYGSESTVDATRPRLGEVASVVTLAVRARILGLQATPRALAWYHTIRAFTLLSLLLQAFFVTSLFTFSLGPYGIGVPDFIVWSRAFSLLLVVAFIALALDRIRAARVLAVLAFVATVAGMVTISMAGSLSGGAFSPAPVSPAELILTAWMAVTVVALFGPAPDLHPSPRLWVGLYLVGLLPMAQAVVNIFQPTHGVNPWLQFLNPDVLASAVLAITMAVALSRALRGRERSPHWLLALTPLGALIGALNLLTRPIGARIAQVGDGRELTFVTLSTVSDVALVGFALASAVVSVRLLRRLSARCAPELQLGGPDDGHSRAIG
jgi:hypothetical protein